jgi:hypothetical protein
VLGAEVRGLHGEEADTLIGTSGSLTIDQCATTLCAVAGAAPGAAPPRPPGVPVCVASTSTLSGNASERSMYVRPASMPVMAANSGTFVVNRRVTLTTAALSGP